MKGCVTAFGSCPQTRLRTKNEGRVSRYATREDRGRERRNPDVQREQLWVRFQRLRTVTGSRILCLKFASLRRWSGYYARAGRRRVQEAASELCPGRIPITVQEP